MCSCSSHTVVLTPSLLCGAALLRPYSALRLHLTASLLHSRTEGVQQATQLPTQYRRATLIALPMHAQQSCHPRPSALQPKLAASHHTGQLRFREELMHELLKQLPAKDMPRKRGADLHPAHALASEHFSTRVDEERDCTVCSRRSVCRVQTHLICAACQVHLCMGTCFAQYHA